MDERAREGGIYTLSYISTGSKRLNRLLGGGIPAGTVTEIYGPSGSGKTQLCHQLAVNVQLPRSEGGLEGKAAYIDTEGKFRPDRIISIASAAGYRPERALENIFVARVFTGQEFEAVVKLLPGLIEDKDVKLVLVDSFSPILREAMESGGHIAKYMTSIKYLAVFRRLARYSNVVVVLTNRVVGKMGEPLGFESVGGRWVKRLVDLRLRFERADGLISAWLEFAPHTGPGEATFIIAEGGISDAEL